MNIAKQTNTEREELGQLIGRFTVALMTSLDAQGTIVGRPMTALEMDGDGVLWFFTQAHSAKTLQLANVNLGFSDVADNTFVSIYGHGEMGYDRAHIERLWTPFARPWFTKGAGSASLGLLRFVPAGADYWDGPNNTMVRLMAAAASVAMGRPIGLGEHGRLDELDDTQTAARAAAAASDAD